MWAPTLPLVVWFMHPANMPLMVVNLLPSRTVQQKQKVEHMFRSGSTHGQQPYVRAIQGQPQNALQAYNWFHDSLIYLIHEPGVQLGPLVMVPPIAFERPALGAELQKNQFIATGTKCLVSLVFASVVIWEHLSAGDAVLIVLRNSVTEIPNTFLKIACEEAIAKRQFREYTLGFFVCGKNGVQLYRPSTEAMRELKFQMKNRAFLLKAKLVGRVAPLNMMYGVQDPEAAVKPL